MALKYLLLSAPAILGVAHSCVSGSCLADEPQEQLALVQRQVSVHVDASSGCPNKHEPSVKYVHIPKTGGSAMNYLLEAVVKVDHYDIVNPFQGSEQDTARLASSDLRSHFVIGVVRRPCDHLLSWYYQGLNDGEKWAVDLDKEEGTEQGFKSFVRDVVAGNRSFTFNALMSKGIEQHYGTGENVHCMIRTHELKDDFTKCVKQFKACGGAVKDDWEGRIDAALTQATDKVHLHGRSVGDHPSCTSMFDKDMMESVLQTEESTINKYHLGSCCSSESDK